MQLDGLSGICQGLVEALGSSGHLRADPPKRRALQQKQEFGGRAPGRRRPQAASGKGGNRLLPTRRPRTGVPYSGEGLGGSCDCGCSGCAPGLRAAGFSARRLVRARSTGGSRGPRRLHPQPRCEFAAPRRRQTWRHVQREPEDRGRHGCRPTAVYRGQASSKALYFALRIGGWLGRSRMGISVSLRIPGRGRR